MTAEDRLAELRSKVDTFFARVEARYPGQLACAPGCADCCRRELTVTAVEAAGIARAVLALDPPARAELARRARNGTPCVALDAAGRCAVYEARPIVCRSHGVPIRFVEPPGDGERAQPVTTDPQAPGARRPLPVLDACFKNFTGMELSGVDPGCVLDQQTLSVLLGAIDAIYTQETGEPRGVRTPLRDVILAAAEA